MQRNCLSSSVETLCQVTREARQRLTASPYASVRRVACQFDAGVLTLSGRLTAFFHKQLAQESVSGLPGVRQVVNQIEVV